MTTVLKALALYTNEAEDLDELSFKINDLLIVIQENWQDGWHLCQLGEKQGVAPANYLQILVKPKPTSHPEESIYDSPRSKNKDELYINTNLNRNVSEQSDMYVYSDYQNMKDDEDDIYMNTSSAALTTSFNDTKRSTASLSPRRVPPPEPRKINYPAAPIPYKQPLQQQTSEYMDMSLIKDMTDYTEIHEDYVGNDYDEVPSNDGYDSGAINNSSNESMRSSSSQLYPMNRSNESLHSSKVSSESIKSIDSGIASSRQERKETPPSIPHKQVQHNHAVVQGSPRLSDGEADIYMVPPSLNNHHHPALNKQRSDHDYFDLATPTKPAKIPAGASQVIHLEEGEYGTSASDPLSHKTKKQHTPTMEKKKKKISSAGVDKLLSNLTLKKNKAGGLGKAQTLSKSLENITKHGVQVQRPLPNVPGSVYKTEGEVSRGSYQKKMEYRPLPPTPVDHELQDYAEIEEEEYVQATTKAALQGATKTALQGATKVALQRQRSRSVTASPVADHVITTATGSHDDDQHTAPERRHSTPNKPEINYTGCHPAAAPAPDQTEFHDYTEVPDYPDIPFNFPPGSNRIAANSVLNSCSSLQQTDTPYRPPLPPTQPPKIPASFPRNMVTPTRTPPLPPPQHGGGAPQNGAVPHHQPLTRNPGGRPVAQVSPIVQIAHSTPVLSPVVTSSPVSSRSSSTTSTAGTRTPVAANQHQVCGIATPSPPTFYSPSTLSQLPTTTYETAETPSPTPLLAKVPLRGKPPVMLVEIDIFALSESDKVLIREHCGVISSALLRATTESLIKLKYVTDNRDIENYVPACTATGSACIEIIKHLTVLADKCQNPDLYNLTFAHKTKLREIVKRLVESIKMAKVQFPSPQAHEDMLSRRNELITAVREIKTFVVKLLHPPT